jgi:hypothetical protein
MKNFFLGFVFALLVFVAVKEVTAYYFLVYVDKSSYVDDTGFHSDDTVPVPLSAKFHDWLGHEYFGVALTGRCESPKSIQYFGCDSFQIWLGRHSK